MKIQTDVRRNEESEEIKESVGHRAVPCRTAEVVLGRVQQGTSWLHFGLCGEFDIDIVGDLGPRNHQCCDS